MPNEPDIAADVERWARAREWSWDEASYLLVGLDPRKIQKLPPDLELDLKDVNRHTVRDALAFDKRFHDVPERVPPAEALDIVARAGLLIPDNLAEAVERFAVSPSTPAIENVPTGDRRKLNKLQKLLLGVAVVKYGYNPRVSRQDAIADMVRDAELIGIRVDRGTVRARLVDAQQNLTADEEPGFEEFLSNR